MVWTEPLVVALYVMPLLLAMGMDLVFSRVPWAVVGAALAGFPVAAVLAPVPVDWLGHGLALVLAAGAAALVVLAGAIDRTTALVGVAAALWVGMEQLLNIALLSGLLGALLAFGVYGTRLLLPPLFRAMGQGGGRMPRLFTTGAPIPYATAIGLAALLLTPRLPLLPGA